MLKQSRKSATWYCKYSKKYKKPVIALAGDIKDESDILYNNGFDTVFSIANGPMSLQYSIKNANNLLSDQSTRIFRLIKCFKKD